MKKPKSRKKLIIVLVVILVLGSTGYYLGNKYLFNEVAAANYTEYTVTRGDLSVSLSGSGSIQPKAQYDVVSIVGGDVIEDFFVEGDSVEKGDMLYVFDSSEIESTIERANLSLEKTRLSYDRTQESYNALNIYAPDAGRVTEINVNVGDNINSGGRVAKIIDDRYLTARIPFSSLDIPMLNVGDRVDVIIENTFEVLSGVITRIYSSNRIIDGYMEVTDVEISVENPGALSEGVYVSVNAGSIACFEGGVLSGGAEKVVLAKTGGLVEVVDVVEGEYISAGTLMVKLSSDTTENSLRDSSLTLKEAELSWENTEKQLKDYSITAPISGSVISKSIKAGDTLENNTKTVMAVIADMSAMSFTIQVDELDIAKVSKGQIAQITVDALAGQFFTGAVDNVGILGTTNNGVTTYPVKILFDQSEGLWPGMNATADIELDSVSNVLMIPVSAVSRGNLVLVKGAQSENETDANGNPSENQSNTVDSFTENNDTSGFSDTTSDGPVGGYSDQAASPGPGGYPNDRQRPQGMDGASGGAIGWGGGRLPEDPEERARFLSEAGITEADLESMRTRRGFGSNENMDTPGTPGESFSQEESETRRSQWESLSKEEIDAMRAQRGMNGPGGGPGSDTGPANGGPDSDMGSATGGPGSDTVSANGGPGSDAESAGEGRTMRFGQGMGQPEGAQAGNSPNTGGANSPAGRFSMPEAPSDSHYVFVELGLNNDSFIEVISGLNEGDVILIEVVSEGALRQNTMMFGAPMMGGAMPVQRINGGGGGGAGGGTFQRREGGPGQ